MSGPDRTPTQPPSQPPCADARCQRLLTRLSWHSLAGRGLFRRSIPLRPERAARRLIQRSLGVALAAGLLLTPAGATVTWPVGPVAPVSPATGTDQLRPAAAMDAQGNVVVVWQGYNPASAGYDIFAQRYATDGTALGAAFVVNQFTAGKQSRPAVALDADGDFVVAWDGAGPSGDGQEIWVRRFAADGAPRSGDVLAPRSSAGSQFDPAVAIDTDGDYVVAWQGAVAGDSAGVAFQRFSRDGVALSASDSLPYGGAAAAAGEQSSPSVTIDPDGDFAVAWETYSYDSDAQTLNYEITLRPYSAAGAAQSEPQTITAASGTASVRAPALVTLPDGQLAVAWEYTAGPVSDTHIGLAIRARLAQAPSTPLQVSPNAAAQRYGPALAVDSSGMLIVTWGDSTTRSGDAPVGLAARYVTGAGELGGEVFYPALPGEAGVGTTVVGVAAASARPDTWLAVWDSEPAGGATATIYRRRYAGPAVLISAGASLQLAEGGASATIGVVLRTAPGADVTITITPQSDRVALGGAAPGQPLQLRFTPANATTPQSVSIRLIDDNLHQGSTQSTLSLALTTTDPAYTSAPLLINGGVGASLPVTLIDNDTELEFVVHLPLL